MKHALPWIVCCIGLAAVSSHAEPARKGASSKGVDLEAAAQATAALYATMPSAPVPAASNALKARPLASSAKPVRSSPLLPQTQTVTHVQVLAEQESPTPQAAGEVWAGAYQCELAEKVSLRPGSAPDQVELQWKTQRWQMRRMDSRSGAMRLEDASARMVWIQLPNKSMLLDQRQGRRLLDECQHDVQVQTAAQMKANPPPSLFDTNGMGR